MNLSLIHNIFIFAGVTVRVCTEELREVVRVTPRVGVDVGVRKLSYWQD